MVYDQSNMGLVLFLDARLFVGLKGVPEETPSPYFQTHVYIYIYGCVCIHPRCGVLQGSFTQAGPFSTQLGRHMTYWPS